VFPTPGRGAAARKPVWVSVPRPSRSFTRPRALLLVLVEVVATEAQARSTFTLTLSARAVEYWDETPPGVQMRLIPGLPTPR
jgi:hypothetical protein